MRKITPANLNTMSDTYENIRLYLMWKSCNETRTLNSHARFVDLLRPFVLIDKSEQNKIKIIEYRCCYWFMFYPIWDHFQRFTIILE